VTGTKASGAESSSLDVLPVPETRHTVPYSNAGWLECGKRLSALSGIKQDQQTQLVLRIRDSSIVRTSDFLSHLYAIAYVESRFNEQAVSSSKARGLLQLTSIGAEEAALECGLPILTEDSMDRLLKSSLNVRYSSCLLRKYLRETKGSWFHALILYNGGYLQLTRYLSTGTLTEETHNYVMSVLSAYGICSVPN
jgi:hypothetical protein